MSPFWISSAIHLHEMCVYAPQLPYKILYVSTFGPISSWYYICLRESFCSLHDFFLSRRHIFTYHFNITFHNSQLSENSLFVSLPIDNSKFFLSLWSKRLTTETLDLGKIALWKQIHCVRTVQATLPTFFTFACRMDGFSFALCMRYNDNCASMGLVTLCVRRQLYQLQSDASMRLTIELHTQHINMPQKSPRKLWI